MGDKGEGEIKEVGRVGIPPSDPPSSISFSLELFSTPPSEDKGFLASLKTSGHFSLFKKVCTRAIARLAFVL